MTVYGANVRITPVGEAQSIDVDCDVADVSINHGRGDPGAQPEASTASITMPLGLADGVEIGAQVLIGTDVPPGGSVRFVGTVTDIATEWETRYDPTNGVVNVLPVARIMAAGPLADSGRRYVGDVPWSQETDGARVSRILTGIGAYVRQVDPGTVQILARDVDRQPALSLMQDVATDAAGVVWEPRDGGLCYADADHRRNTPVSLTLDACDVVMSPRWSRSRSGLVNDIAVRYGVDPAGGEQPAATASNAASIATYGRMAYSVATQLAALADANAMAQLLMVRNSQPAWLLDGIRVDLAILDATKTAAVLGMDIHSLLAITGFPAGGPSSSATLWLEGWTEDISLGQHVLSLFVSSYCRTAPPPTWDEVPPTWTWDTIDTAVVRRNMIPNPRIGVNLNGWVEYGGTNTRLTGQGGTGWALGTTTALRATMQDAAVVPTYATGVYTAALPVTVGRFYGALLQVRSNRPQRVMIDIEFYDAAGNYVGASWETPSAQYAVLTPNVVTTLVNLPFGAMTGAVNALIGVYPAPNNTGDGGPSIVSWQAGDWMEITNAQLEETGVTLTATTDPVTGIFHGARPDTLHDDYAWAGTADASASTRTTPPRLTWDAITCFGGPLPTYGRWADVPASLRWDAVDPPGTTWDGWEWIDQAQWETYPVTTTWDSVPDGSTWDIPPNPGS